MKSNSLKILSLLILVTLFGKMNAQSGLLAVNSINNVQAPNQEAALYNEQEKIRIGDITEDPANSKSLVRINSLLQLTMQVKVFDMNGDLAKIETHNLNNGINDLKVDMGSLAAGTYIVQFYTKEGSAIRRFVKNN